MKHIFIFALAIALIFSTTATERVTGTIIGFWRVTKSESSDKSYQNPSEQMEMEFHEGGTYFVKYLDPAGDIKQTQTFEGKFTLISPDRVNISIDGKTQEKYRYVLTEGQLRLEHLEYSVTNTLKRVTKFSL